MTANRLIIFMLLLLTTSRLSAQALQDSLGDDTIYAMKKGAERALQDYNAAMRELINPRISKSYRDRIVTEFTTPGNRQIFTPESYVVYDYDGDYLPPLDTKERPVRTYLTDFNIFYQGTTAQQTLEVYYSLQRIYDVQKDAEGYYLIVDFESLYGGLLPQPRRATLRLQQQKNRWKALISYVKFNIEQEDPYTTNPEPTTAVPDQNEPLVTETKDAPVAEAQTPEVLPDDDTTNPTEAFTGRFVGLKKRYTQGKPYRVAWSTSSKQPLALDLYQGQNLVKPLQQDLTGNEYTWQVPKDLPKGNYRFQLRPESTGSPLESGVFRIKKKTPWGIYVGVSVAAVAVAVYFLQPNETKTGSPLIDPPGVPGN